MITANALMAYVYHRVGTDSRSQQTPHFGFIDGDGDFIFDSSVLAKLEQSDSDADGIKIEPSPFPIPILLDGETVSEAIKRLVANSGSRIELNDFISDLTRRTVESLNSNKFSVQQAFTSEEFVLRLERYEAAVSDLVPAVILLARWGEPEQIRLVQKIFARVGEAKKPLEGLVWWLGLEWYPLLILMYAAGIASLAAEKASGLGAALLTPVYSERSPSGPGEQPVVIPVIENMTRAVDAFKTLPDMARKYVPRSEYLFEKLQPLLEAELHLGRSYEGLFDKFEILLSLCYADLNSEDPSRYVWGPPGRFWYKQYSRTGGDRVYSRFVTQAKSSGDRWEPLSVGFFRGSAQRFAEIADAFDKELSSHTLW